MKGCLARNKHSFMPEMKYSQSGKELFQFPITNSKYPVERSFLNVRAHIDSIDDVTIIVSSINQRFNHMVIFFLEIYKNVKKV